MSGLKKYHYDDMSTMIENTIENFKEYLQQLGYGKGTAYMLPKCVNEFLTYFLNFSVEEITSRHIVAFYHYLHERPLKRGKGGALSDTMISHYMYSLRTFFNYLEQTGQVTYNPISSLKFKRPEVKSREPLTRQEIDKLFETAQTPKEKAILHLFYSCGLRRSEAVALNTGDIHFKSCLLYVREGKGAKRRSVPLTHKVSNDLLYFFSIERKNIKTDTPAFIVSHTGRRMSGGSFNKLFKELLNKSEISNLKFEISLHHLRHSIATHLLESGLSIEYVRDFLGHRHLESTQVYTKYFSFQLKNK